MRKTYLIILFFIIQATAFAQLLNFQDDVLSKKEQKNLEQAIRFQLNFYQKAFPHEGLNFSNVRVSIYIDGIAYQAKQYELFGHVKKGSYGFYSLRDKEAVIFKKKGTDYMRVCYHEISHFFINTYSRRIPIWLNEGLATYFENIKISSKEVKAQKNKWYIIRVKTMINTRDLDIPDFLTWNHEKFNNMSFSHQGYGYALGHALVWFMMEKNPVFIIKCIQSIEGGKAGGETLEELYEGGLKKLEEDFIKYIQENK
ncbi:MAG: DUF1570 domain-containing protein [Prevotella sp.]|jgi:hypothetical protein|nr:DUF1570 domain-containing protein [Prevotella sp.]